MTVVYCYEHPHPAVAVDVAVFRHRSTRLEVLLIRRGAAPFAGRWALPGGFVNIDEDLASAAARELAEETGLEIPELTQVGAFGAPERDPRERVVSVAYCCCVSADAAAPRAASDAAAAAWFDVASLPPLAFDHDEIIEAARRRVSAPGR